MAPPGPLVPSTGPHPTTPPGPMLKIIVTTIHISQALALIGLGFALRRFGRTEA